MMDCHTPDTIRRALAYIPAHDRDTWIKVGMGVKSELGDEGFPMFDEWSQSAPDQYNARDTEAAWKSFKPNGGTTIGTTLHLAKMNGFDVASAASRRVAAPPARERVPAVDTAKEAKAAEEAKGKAARLWQEASPAAQDNAYLKRKGVASVLSLREIRDHHARQILNYTPRQGEEELAGPLLVVPIKRAGELVSAELIDGEGRKHCIFGSKVGGAYWAAQKMPTPSDLVSPTLCIGEGVATMLSVREATDYLVVAARYAGNLEQVALAMKALYPKARIVIAGDVGNGQSQAEAAARAAPGALLALPVFAEGAPEGVKDFNDLHQVKGLEAVRACIEAARAPDEPAPARAQPTQVSTRQTVAGKLTGEVLHGPRVAWRRFSELESRPVRWLWPERIARGKVSIIAGNPGLGKSQVTASVAAIVTTGGLWPVDRTPCERGSVIFLSCEDDPEDTIRPRLVAAGADVARCAILEAVVEGFSATGGEVRRSFNLKTDLERLAEMLDAVGDVALVVIDPISAYLGDTNSHNNAEIRALLAPLAELAARRGIAILCVSHLNKGGNPEALMRVTGSLAFVAAARSAYLVAADKDDPRRRLFLPLKSNNGPDQGGLAFTIEAVTSPSPSGPIASSRIMWEPEAVTITADEAMAPALCGEERTDLDDATAFLRDLLRDGPVPSRRVKAEADGCGHSWATMRRAQKALQVEATKEGMSGPWLWRLPPKMLKNPEDAHAPMVSTFAETEHLRGSNGTDEGGDEVL